MQLVRHRPRVRWLYGSGIGHIRDDHYDCFYGIVRNHDAACFETYMAEGVLMAVVDTCTETFDLPPDEGKEGAETSRLPQRGPARGAEECCCGRFQQCLCLLGHYRDAGD